MQAIIDRVMNTLGMFSSLTAEKKRRTLQRLSSLLSEIRNADENRLAVEGLRCLRATSRSRKYGRPGASD